MFKKIESILVLTGTTKRCLAKKIGLSYNTLLAKLRGEFPFTLDEAIKIKQALATQETVEELFVRYDQPDKTA